MLAVRAIVDAMLAAVCAELDVAHRRAVDEARRRAARLLAEEVLEDAAVELVARRRQEAARAELGHLRRCRARPSEKKKRKPNFFSCARLEVLRRPSTSPK